MQNYIAAMQKKYLNRFQNIKKWLIADVTSDVKNVLIAIKEIIALQTHMGEPLPRTYLELENLVIAEKANRNREGKPPIVTWSEWIKMGNIANIHDEGTLTRATKLFHEMVNFLFLPIFDFFFFST